MRNLTATICLTIAVLLGSFGGHANAVATDVLQSRFGQVNLNLPYPGDLCLLGKSQGETTIWEHQSLAQRKSGNKLLAVWINCDTQKFLRKGGEVTLEEWVIVVGTLTGTPKSERIYPRLSADSFLNMFSNQQKNISLDEIFEKVDRSIGEANSTYFRDKNAVKITEPINLGILAIEDSVHTGMIFNVKTKFETVPTTAISSTSLIKGAPINHYFYKTYKGKKTVKELLSKAKYYSAQIIHAN